MTTRTPVALIFFRRADAVRRVFEVLRQVKPPKLFLIADGPSAARPGEDQKCAAARAVVENVDWDCEVVRDYSPTNMGPWRRIASGITSAFGKVEDLIILEDDCVPDPTFFPYCDELLERYRDDLRVMHISGHNFHTESPRRIPYSYSFIAANGCWGYATWRRAWKHFDLALPDWDELRKTDFLQQYMGHPDAIRAFAEIFDELHAHPGEIDGYDYSWAYACWKNNGLAVLPAYSMIRNIGFGPDSTHFPTSGTDDPREHMDAAPMPFPLRHPPYMIRDMAAEQVIWGAFAKPKEVKRTLPERAYRKLRRILASLVPRAKDGPRGSGARETAC